MQDGDPVRVTIGRFAGLSGVLVGEPSIRGVAIKLPGSSSIIPVPYPPGVRTADGFLEPVQPNDAIGGIPQIA